MDIGLSEFSKEIQCGYDYQEIYRAARLIVDTRNALGSIADVDDKIVSL